MKKWLSFLLAITMAISLAACGAAEQEDSGAAGGSGPAAEQTPETPDDGGEAELPAAENTGETNVLGPTSPGRTTPFWLRMWTPSPPPA